MAAKPNDPVDTAKNASSEGWQSEWQLRQFVESVQDYAIFMLDPAGHVVTWNKGAERLKGYSKNDILGKHFSIFYTADDRRRRHPESELEIARKEGRYQEEGWRRRKDGTLFYADVVITAVRDANGEIIGFGKVTRDLTQRRLREEQERKLNEEQAARMEAEAANRAKSDLLALISHELRSPLTAVIGYTDLLLTGVPEPVPETSKRPLERIRAAAHHLRQMIEQILTFSRIQLGQEKLHYETADLGDLIRETAGIVEPLAHGKGLSFPVHAPAEPVTIQTDPTKLRQILWNLVSNAVNFTDEGEVSVAAQAMDDEIVLEVRDTGKGIPADDLDHVFEPFHQAHVESKRHGGTGLGLSVAKHLSELMGGSIRVRSTVGEGTTFTVRLPRGEGRTIEEPTSSGR